MTFKGPGGFGRIVNIIMNLFICAAMSLFMLWMAQQRVSNAAEVLTPTAFVFAFIPAFGIGFATADIIPVFMAGSGVSKKLGLKGVPAYLVTVLVIDLIMTTIIGFLMTMISLVERAGFVGAFMSWASTYLISLLMCYVIMAIVMKPAMSFAKRVSGFDPDNPGAYFASMMAAGMPGGPGGPGMGGPAGPNTGGPGMGAPGAGGPGAPGGPNIPGGSSAPGEPHIS